MGKDKNTELRRQAEERLKKRFEKLDELHNGDPQRLIHELRAHQIELEMQNEELRKAQAELENSRTRYSNLYDFAPVGYFTFDKNGLIIEVNLPGVVQLGAERNSLINKSFSGFVHKDDQDIFFLHRNKVFKTMSLQVCEIRLNRKNGVEFYAQMQSLAVKEHAGNAVYCMTAVSDITERKRADEALRESNKLNELLLDSIPYPTMLIRRDRTILAANKIAREAGAVVGELCWQSFGHSEYISDEAKLYLKEHYGESCSSIRCSFCLADEETVSDKPANCEVKSFGRLWDTWWVPVKDDIYLHYANDITEHKQLMEKLRESEERYRSIFEGANDGIIACDIATGEFLFANKRAAALTGYSEQEILKLGIKDLHPPEDLPHVLEQFNKQAAGEITKTTALPMLRKDKSIIYCDISSSFLGKTTLIGFFRDVTERKKAEDERDSLIEELKKSNAELEQFAYVASHDLQEPLRMVTSYVEIIDKRYRDKLEKDAGEFIDYAVSGATHMRALLNDLLMYSRVGSKGKSFELTDLNVSLKSALSNLKKSIEESRAEISSGNLPGVYADETQMVQLFQNLIGNAIKFRGDKAPDIQVSAEWNKTGWVIRVSDNGIGIDPKFFDKIFLIFQRLHARDKYPGTGIGLSICKKIAECHGGRIWVESEVGKGTTFYFTLPVKNNRS